jgi:MFS family permease
VLFAGAPVDASYVADVLPSMLLLGAGAGLAFPALMMLAMSSATPADSGLASGLVNTSLQVGGAIGLAVLATLATTRTENLAADGTSAASALTSGYHLAFLIGAGLALVALAIAIALLRPGQAPAAAEAAEHGPALEHLEPALSEVA